jgi:ABC-2 type transport system permease protein
MFESLDAYYSVFLVNLKDQFAYRGDTILTLLFSLITAGVMIVVWSAVYLSSGTTAIAGIGLTTLYAYFLFVPAFRTIFDLNFSMLMQDDFTSGNVSVSLSRPIKYVYQVFMAVSAGIVRDTLVVAIPLLVAGFILFHPVVSISTAVFLIPEILIAFIIAGCIDFMIGCVAVYTTQIWGLLSINYAITYTLGGGIVPLSFLPTWAAGIVNLLPFKYEIYVPIATLLNIGSINFGNALLLGSVWCVILLSLAALMWRGVKRKIAAVGG